MVGLIYFFLGFCALSSWGRVPDRLEETGLYSNVYSKAVTPGIRPFSPQYPLWSDGAKKGRWIFLPPGDQIDTDNLDRWVFPVGTRVWKEFSFGGKRVETRYFEKISEGKGIAHWDFGTYQWDTKETSATLVSEWGQSGVASIGGGKKHRIPSRAECIICHSRGGDPILGFDLLQLSSDRDPLAPHGELSRPDDLLLPELERTKTITYYPRRVPRIISKTQEGRAMMGYFHGNCSHCHNPKGFAKGSLFFNRFKSEVDKERWNPAYDTSVEHDTFKLHVPGRVPGFNSYRIDPGSPETSSIYLLMSHREKHLPKMPLIGSDVVDEEALALLVKWIEAL